MPARAGGRPPRISCRGTIDSNALRLTCRGNHRPSVWVGCGRSRMWRAVSMETQGLATGGGNPEHQSLSRGDPVEFEWWKSRLSSSLRGFERDTAAPLGIKGQWRGTKTRYFPVTWIEIIAPQLSRDFRGGFKAHYINSQCIINELNNRNVCLGFEVSGTPKNDKSQIS